MGADENTAYAIQSNMHPLTDKQLH